VKVAKSNPLSLFSLPNLFCSEETKLIVVDTKLFLPELNTLSVADHSVY
jgi:hypothetical protein